MKYLLDVNALVALGLIEHTLNCRVVGWLQANSSLEFVTCSITELGFVRVIAQTPGYGMSVEQAKDLLLRMKQPTAAISWEFLADDQDVSGLPGWVKTGGHTTDGHLVQLAGAHGAMLATLDGKIPGAFVIP